MVDILRTGLSGLMAFQSALATTSHNIANANTPGYSRQRVELTTNLPGSVGTGGRSIHIGTGVNVQSISRLHDEFMTQQVRSHGANVAQSDTMSSWISQLDGVLGDSATGLAPALNQFFGAVQDVANSPASSSARQALLGQAGSLAARFQEMDGQMDALRAGVNQSLSSAVGEVNRLAESIAKANTTIAVSQGNGGASADLLDQRDQLVADLAQRVPLNTVIQDDGSMSVFIGTGQTLVLGGQANPLEAARSGTDSQQLEVRFKGSKTSIDDFINGGAIGGLLDFQHKVLEPAQNKLGLMAVGLSETFNAQHQLGKDANGDPGGAFFSSITPTVGPDRANTGSGAVSASIASANGLQPSSYELSFDGTDYRLRRLSDDTVVASGAGPFNNIDGLNISIGGTPAAGDRFLIQPTGGGAGDFKVAVTDPAKFAAADLTGGVGNNANANRLAELQNSRLLLNGASTFQEVQSQMVSEVGVHGSSARSALQAQTALLEHATQMRDSFSGVNLDEEAANLMRYQQAYGAAAKVIQVGDAIIQSLLNAVGR